MKTIELIKQKCETSKQEIIKELEPKFNFGTDLEKSIESLFELESMIDLKLKPLGNEIQDLIQKSNEDKELLDKQSIVIFKNLISDIITKFI
jgi:hypothetical protein